MLQTKLLEVSDQATRYFVMAIKMYDETDKANNMILRRGLGFSMEHPNILIVDPNTKEVQYNALSWPANPRTNRYAAMYIEKHWDELKDGDVVDAYQQYVIETNKRLPDSKKVSVPEREETQYPEILEQRQKQAAEKTEA